MVCPYRSMENAVNLDMCILEKFYVYKTRAVCSFYFSAFVFFSRTPEFLHKVANSLRLDARLLTGEFATRRSVFCLIVVCSRQANLYSELRSVL